MEENILKIGKVLAQLVSMELLNKGIKGKKPSVSYIAQVSLKNAITFNILENTEGIVMVRGIFAAYNLLNGDTDIEAVRKTDNIFMIDTMESDGYEYFNKSDCDYCGGEGQVECDECGGDGQVPCDKCGSDDDDESCSDCNGDEYVYCDACSGDGNYECPECEGDGEIDDNEESIDIVYSTVLTQNSEFVDEVKNNIGKYNSVNDFKTISEKYDSEIMLIDNTADTILFEDEWGGYDTNFVSIRLEGITLNHPRYRIQKKPSTYGSNNPEVSIRAY